MGLGGAPWLDREEREAEEAPMRALSIMQVTPGSSVADIGAGSGYFTERLARLVGPTGKVVRRGHSGRHARFDSRPPRTRTHRQRVADPERAGGSETAGAVDRPGADGGRVSQELHDPQAVLGHVREALKPGGRLVLVEYKGEDPSIPILPLHKMTVAQAKLEVEAEGFALTTTDSSLPRQHVLIFTRK